MSVFIFPFFPVGDLAPAGSHPHQDVRVTASPTFDLDTKAGGTGHYWQFGKTNLSGTDYPTLLPVGVAGNYGVIVGGIITTEPVGAGDVTIGLYNSSLSRNWNFLFDTTTNILTLSKIGHTAGFNISSDVVVTGDLSATNISGANANWDDAYTHSQIAGGNSVHVSTTENTHWDGAYTHSQIAGGNSVHVSTTENTHWDGAYTHSQIAGGDSVHVSTDENTNWDDAYIHSQVDTGNPHSVTATQAGALALDGSNANADIDLGVYKLIHDIASHSDTTATGAELETLTNNSIANTLHRHSELVALDGSPDPALSVNSTGKVGIGTSNASEALEIYSASLGHGYTTMLLRGRFPNTVYHVIRAETGDNGAAFKIIDLKAQNSHSTQDWLAVGAFGSVNQGSAPSLSYFFIGNDYNDAFVKIDSGNKMALGLTGYTRPTGAMLEVHGAISSGTLDCSVSSDVLDVSGVNTVFVNSSGGNVVLGGLSGGVNGQHLIITHKVTGHNLTLESQEATGTQKFYLIDDSDETITTHGGWTLVCDGSNWYGGNHAKHT